MKKKWWVMGASVGLGVVLLWGAGLPVRADNSGLAAYEAAMKHTKTETSLTAHVKLDITDNGKPLFKGAGEAKVDRDKQEASVSGTLEDVTRATTQSFQAFREDGKVIVKKGDSDVYRVIEPQERRTKHFKAPANPPVIVEQVSNIALGNIRELSTVENLPDGSKQVSLLLKERDVPVFVNKAATMIFSKLAEQKQDAASGKDFPVRLPELQEDIQVEQVFLNATIDENNRIEHQSAEIHVSGRDVAGQEHEITVKLDVTLSDFSQTNVEHMDLTGKQVERIEGWHRPARK
ncbi:hypothetical protein [Brevibacillus choshinensis]|uniref:hypothetical protein n=1 Tax=Brevibacillus choshinensis TaxID=54911 RepID=UPI002E233C1D|nr:hypothetical protein [Brevibacillus choshinensis]MED4784242.1 hypothetical protein [Brevibacillus choshinensis]